MKRMRIVQVCPRYHPYVGGIETVVKQISERLVKKGVEVDILTTDPLGRFLKKETINRVRITRFISWAPKEAYYFPDPRILSTLLTTHTDIIHAYNIHALTTFTTYSAHNLHKTAKLIVSPYYHARGNTKLAQMLWVYYKYLAKKILEKLDGIIVNSKTQRDLIKKDFKPLSKIFIISDGVNSDGIKNSKPFILDEKIKILLYVGRIEKYKNIHLAILSMKYLPENYHFFVIGKGSYRSSLEDIVRSLNLQNRVHFLGFQTDNVVFRWLKTAHVFIHLSDVESFGMTCIESLAAGTPVIANDDNFGLNETISLYPKHIKVFRVGKECVYKLANTIKEVTTMKPIKVDISQFSWDRVTEDTIKIYNQILYNQ